MGCPRYSVVVPALDEQDYLGACLASLAGQDYPAGFEFIVVDNDSTDATAVIAAAAGATVVFARTRRRVRAGYGRHGPCGGRGARV